MHLSVFIYSCTHFCKKNGWLRNHSVIISSLFVLNPSLLVPARRVLGMPRILPVLWIEQLRSRICSRPPAYMYSVFVWGNTYSQLTYHWQRVRSLFIRKGTTFHCPCPSQRKQRFLSFKHKKDRQIMNQKMGRSFQEHGNPAPSNQR